LALSIRPRLSSSKSPWGFEQIIYGKGSWDFTWGARLMRQPGAKKIQMRGFIALLHTLASHVCYRAYFQRGLDSGNRQQ